MNPLDDLTLLRSFVRAAECGGITLAARALGLPQPTVSRHLKTLESRCGVALLRRDTHRSSLTEAGARLLDDARKILEQADAAVSRLEEGHLRPSGHLRVFSTVEFGQSVVTRLLARFLLENPGITAELRYTNRPQRLIGEGFDAGVVVGDLTDDAVVALPAGNVERCPVASPALLKAKSPPRTPAELAELPWLSLAEPQFGGARKVVLESQGKPPVQLDIAPVLVSEGAFSLAEAARIGLGAAVLPDWLIADDLASGTLVRLLPRWRAQPLPIHVIYLSHRKLPARVRSFVDFALGYLSRELRVRKPRA